MEHHIYDKIVHKDGRIENFHYCVNDVDAILDMQNSLKKKGSQINFISEAQWEDEKSIRVKTDYEFEYPCKIAIHQDLEFPGDAQGAKIGYLQHYTLTK